MLSNTGVYALRAVVHLAEREGTGPVRVEDVATALSVPRNYLSKILHTLVKRGLLASLRGPKGGFELAVSSGAISLLAVLEPFEGMGGQQMCLLGGADCGGEGACAVHERWKGTASEVALFFRETTIADVVGSGDRGGVEATGIH